MTTATIVAILSLAVVGLALHARHLSVELRRISREFDAALVEQLDWRHSISSDIGRLDRRIELQGRGRAA